MARNKRDKNFLVVCDETELFGQPRFTHFLTDEVKNALGEVNPRWFEEAVSERIIARTASERTVDSCLHSVPRSAGLQTDDSVSPSITASSVQSPILFDWSPICSPSLCSSTPGRLALSLGASLGGHDMSWTSSMATPLINNSSGNSDTDISEETLNLQNKLQISQELFTEDFIATTSISNNDCEHSLNSSESTPSLQKLYSKLASAPEANVDDSGGFSVITESQSAFKKNSLITCHNVSSKVTSDSTVPASNVSTTPLQTTCTKSKKGPDECIEKYQEHYLEYSINSSDTTILDSSAISDSNEFEDSAKVIVASNEPARNLVCSDNNTPKIDKKRSLGILRKRMACKKMFTEFQVAADNENGDAFSKRVYNTSSNRTDTTSVPKSEIVSRHGNVSSGMSLVDIFPSPVKERNEPKSESPSAESQTTLSESPILHLDVLKASDDGAVPPVHNAKCPSQRMLRVQQESIVEHENAQSTKDKGSSESLHESVLLKVESESCNSIVSCVESEHDYAKPQTSCNQDVSGNAEEEFDDYDSHGIDMLTQVMDGVESAAACLESLKNEEFPNEFYSSTQILKPATKRTSKNSILETQVDISLCKDTNDDSRCKVEDFLCTESKSEKDSLKPGTMLVKQGRSVCDLEPKLNLVREDDLQKKPNISLLVLPDHCAKCSEAGANCTCDVMLVCDSKPFGKPLNDAGVPLNCGTLVTTTGHCVKPDDDGTFTSDKVVKLELNKSIEIKPVPRSSALAANGKGGCAIAVKMFAGKRVNRDSKVNMAKDFVAASGKAISVSSESFERARQAYEAHLERIIQEEKCDAKTLQANLVPQNVNKYNTSNLAKNISAGDKEAIDRLPVDDTKSLDCDKSFKGFATAGGKAVKVSKKALEEARHMLKELDEKFLEKTDQRSQHNGKQCETGNSEDVKSCVSTPDDNSLKSCYGFSTASGKTVTVSKKSLEKAKKLLEDVDQSVSHDISAKQRSPPTKSLPVSDVTSLDKAAAAPPAFVGFSTASGKIVAISEKTLENARKSFQVHLDLTEDGDRDIHMKKEETSKRLSHTNELLLPVDGQKRPTEKISHKCSDSSEGMFAGVTSMAGGDNLSNTSHVSRVVEGRGMKRSGSSVFDESGTRPCKILPKQLGSKSENFVKEERLFQSTLDLHDDVIVKCCGLQQLSKSEYVLGKTFAVSEDSLDAAEALIAMSNSHRPKFAGDGDAMTVKGGCDYSILDTSKKNVAMQNASELSASSYSPCRSNNHVDEADEPGSCNVSVNMSAQELSMEILDCTAAFLEDELLMDSSLSESVCALNLSNLSRCEKSLVGNIDSPNTTLKHSFKNVSGLDNEESSYGAVSGNVCGVRASTDACTNSVSNTLSEESLQQERKTALEDQQRRMTEASHKKIMPVLSSWYSRKMEKRNRVSLRRFFNNCTPCRQDDKVALKLGVKESVLRICSKNAEAFCFSFEDFLKGRCDSRFGVVQLDGAVLILNEDKSAGKEEFYKALICCDGVDPKLVSRAWVYNHYRWLIWKLAAMEVSFPHHCAGRLITPERVLKELLYRVNCEIDFSKRSALKKISERDDTPMKTMVLCVSDIFCSSQGQPRDAESSTVSSAEDQVCLEVTDGWYSMRAMIDAPLKDLVHRRKIYVGQKLIVHGAEMMGPSNACSPLELPSNQFLKLGYNSCRCARWDTKLGYFVSPQPFSLPLNSLICDGGLVCRVDVVLARVYSVQYLERLQDGSHRVLSERMNELINGKSEVQRHLLIDKLFSDLQSSNAEFTDASSQKKSRTSGAKCYTVNDIKSFFGGQEISEALNNAVDSAFVESCLSASQKESLVKYRLNSIEHNQARMQSELKKVIQLKQDNGDFPVDRDVVPFVKVRAAGIHEKDLEEKSTCLITIWRPSEELIKFLEEGKCVQCYYLMAERRSFGNELHLKSTKMMKFEQLSVADSVASAVYKPRKFTSLGEIQSPSFQPLYGDVDVVGVVVTVGNLGLPPRSKFEVVYLADADQVIVGVKFWCGLQSFGVETLLQPGSIIAGYNMQWRGREKFPIPCIHSSELSVFTQNPKDGNAKQKLDALRDALGNVQAFVDKSREAISDILCDQSSSKKTVANAALPFHLNKSHWWQGPSNISRVSDVDPVSDQSASLALRRMAQLQRVGPPPPLIAMSTLNSPMACSRFKVPLAKERVK